MKIHDPAFKIGDLVDFSGSASDVVCRSTIDRNYNHICVSPKSLGVIAFVEKHNILNVQWYGILVNGEIVWISVLTQGVILRKFV